MAEDISKKTLKLKTHTVKKDEDYHHHNHHKKLHRDSDLPKSPSFPPKIKQESDSIKSPKAGSSSSTLKVKEVTAKKIKEAGTVILKKHSDDVKPKSIIKTVKEEVKSSAANSFRVKVETSITTNKKSSASNGKEKPEKKVYVLPGQKHDPPEERDPLRIFYESLYEQIPTSEMAQIWSQKYPDLQVNWRTTIPEILNLAI
eukprot:Gb_27663 [translate_table: standard]